MSKKKKNDKQKDEFVQKLQTAIDAVWQSPSYKKRRTNMDRWLKEYNGEWWDKGKLADHDSRIFCNYIFATVETNAPLLTDNRPLWNVRARESHMQDFINVYAKALDYLWDKLELDQETYNVVKDCEIWPVGLWKIRFDPESEFGGEIVVDTDDPRTFFISPGDDDLWSCHYCGTVKRRTLAWIKSNYPDKYEDVQPDDDDKQIDYDKSEDFELQGIQATVYEIWMKDDSVEDYLMEELDEEGKPTGEKSNSTREKYPNGRYVVFSGNGIRLQDEPSPFSHGKPPWVAFYNYREPHSFWGIPEGQQIENLNKEFNKRLQEMVHHCSAHAKTNYLVDEGSNLDINTIKDTIHKGDQVYAANMSVVPEPVKAITPAPFQKVHQDLMQGISNLIEEVSGVTDVSKGMAAKKQRQSATEMQVLIESSYTRTRQKVRNLEASIKRAAYLMLELMQQYYDEPRTFSSAKDNEVEFMPISNSPNFLKEVSQPEQHTGEPDEKYTERLSEDQDYMKVLEVFGETDKVYAAFDIEVQTNSTLPMDKQSQANLALRLGETQVTPMSVIDDEAILDILRFPGKDKILKRKEEKMQQMGPKQPGPGGPMGPPPGPQGPPGPGVPIGLPAGQGGKGE